MPTVFERRGYFRGIYDATVRLSSTFYRFLWIKTRRGDELYEIERNKLVRECSFQLHSLNNSPVTCCREASSFDVINTEVAAECSLLIRPIAPRD